MFKESNKSSRHLEEKKSDLINPQALVILRKQRFEALVNKRKSNITLISKAHSGSSFWLNLCLLTSEDIYKYASTSIPRQRPLHYFYLSLSIESMLQSRSSPLVSLLKSFNQLMEEYEYFSAGSTMQSMRMMMARNSTCAFPQLSQRDNDDESFPGKPSIYKFQNAVVFDKLKTPHISIELDYVEVVVALCEALYNLYEAFLSEDVYSNATAYEVFLRLDDRVRHHFVHPICRELAGLTSDRLHYEIDAMREKLR